MLAERLRPWRREQTWPRPEIGQDIFWLAFNGMASGFLFGSLYGAIYGLEERAFVGALGFFPGSLRAAAGLPVWAQFLAVLVAGDFMEWFVHNALHRVPWLWRFHRVHHSIVVMDWIGNFRFHWGESLLYNSIKHLPMALLGADASVVLLAAVTSTGIGHLNHSNLNISWGPVRYLLNSPRMHIWHHEKGLRGGAGVNFAVVFSLWDWVFRTAYMPRVAPIEPAALGFRGQDRAPGSLLMRFFLPGADRVGAGRLTTSGAQTS